MASYREWMAAEIVDAYGVTHEIGSRANPIETTIAGQVEHKTLSLATATSLTLWNSDESITNFDKLWLKSDQALKIELTVDKGGEVGSEEIVFVHPSGQWFRLASDDALALYTGTLSGGTADVIDEVVIRNESGTTANIEYALIT